MAGVLQQVTSGLRLDLGPLKEPLGFIRVLEWVFSISAFATTCGYSGTTQVKVTCPGSVEEDINADFQYPFKLLSPSFKIPSCDNGTKLDINLFGDLSSSAEFFVCIGVLGFLYCTFALVLYLGYQHVYRDGTRGPMIDLIVTGVFAFLWLVSSSAWGKALTDIKGFTNPQKLAEFITGLQGFKGVCKPGQNPVMGRLNASVIFGFLNLILWGGNCWFIYKETPFHKPVSPPVIEEGPGSS
ncbi:synaptophysin-like protein 2a [Brienomyrus brachyistius]|uniref:synaptophysin-like protein 2a n=1 Tax=Brienomyrus brachyistius TaxID=42636 RepID=UPI0020B42AC7|nr:synaptophysin-like protein 2a [Brienomyrus brachyistius]